jgi:hypothetical protein
MQSIHQKKKMKSAGFVVLFLIIVGSAQAQEQKNGIGIRLGSPLGITYKKYLPKDKALEFILGTADKGWGRSYYTARFEEIDEYDDYIYRSHEVKSTFFAEARYLFQYAIPVEDMEGSIKWYWGIGALLKVAEIEYHYQEMVSPNANFKETRTDIDFGPEAIGGVEYTFQDVPLSLFGDTSLIFEIIDQPLKLRLFGAVGVRYNF